MNITKQKLTSLLASIALLGAAWFSTQNAMAEEQKTEANPKVVIQSNNQQFAEKYPLQYETWKATSDSAELESALEDDPRMVVLWGGYLFSHDYNKPRGHFYAIKDVREILRTGAPTGPNDGPQPMACWTCKGPDVPRLIAEWGEDGYFSGVILPKNN